MSGLLILILIFIGVPFLWRWLKPYFYRWLQRRTLNYIFGSMGGDPGSAGKSRTQQKQAYASSGRDSGGGRRSYSGYSSDRYSGRGRRYSSGPLIPKEYAVDVEYTEIRSYSSDEAIASDGKSVRYKVESQVSDAEIIEIRRDR